MGEDEQHGLGYQRISLLPISSTLNILSIVFAVLTVATCWFWWRSNGRDSGRPRRRRGEQGRLLMPGPRPLPIIGNLHQLGTLPHQRLAEMSSEHGPLMYIRMGFTGIVVVSSSHVAEIVLHTLDKVCAGRPVNLSAPKRIMGPDLPDILFHQPDAYWKFMRQLCVTQFFSNTRFRHFLAVRMRIVREFLRSIAQTALQASNPVSFRDVLHVATNNVIGTMVVGKPLAEFLLMEGEEDITSVLLDVKSSLGMFEIGDYIPWLSWMDLQGCEKRDRVVSQNAASLLQKIIDTRREQRASAKDWSSQDLLDLLLLAEEESNSEGISINDSGVRAVLLNMLVAGTDTSVVSIEWTLAELFRNPTKLEKLQQELEEVVGMSRIVEESDLPNLPYLRSVVNEGLRLHPVGPLLAPHRTQEECEIEGYKVPVDTIVYINAWAIQRDPALWENPSEFKPERFIDRGLLDVVPGQHMEFIPFGGGRRSCPGWRLGLILVQIMVANIVHAFHWSIPGGSNNISMKEKFGIAVSMEVPLMAMPSPKLEVNVLNHNI